jgi:hypothetical protein
MELPTDTWAGRDNTALTDHHLTVGKVDHRNLECIPNVEALPWHPNEVDNGEVIVVLILRHHQRELPKGNHRHHPVEEGVPWNPTARENRVRNPCHPSSMVTDSGEALSGATHHHHRLLHPDNGTGGILIKCINNIIQVVDGLVLPKHHLEDPELLQKWWIGEWWDLERILHQGVFVHQSDWMHHHLLNRIFTLALVEWECTMTTVNLRLLEERIRTRTRDEGATNAEG